MLKLEEIANSCNFLNDKEEILKSRLGEVSQTISDYWLKVLLNSEIICSEITENDKLILKYLTSISY